MDVVGNEKKVVSKNNLGFPEWLDFEKMRQDGMDYLGELSGNLWTDHNLHDPGITILESLCYALLDLGYRTSLPAQDLFSRNPAEVSEEDNFFTPAEILTCNPLTILDYRRLIVDVEGVRNAWLTPIDNVSIDTICAPSRQFVKSPLLENNNQDNCPQFLNGLYRVYLDVEDYEKHVKVKEQVKKALMAHRNLCEDFYDITVLCKQKIGACANIEIEAGSDPGSIFLEIVEKLRSYISPSPKFYSLKQLLEEKHRTIEEIFAGRAYNLADSHGFVDIEEFQDIILRKEFYVSDIYNVIFSVKGVKAVSDLRLKNCDNARCDDSNAWIFKIFEDHVPEFSLECSGFHFTRNGVEIAIDKKKFQQQIDLNFSNNGKSLRFPADLDLALPHGIYRSDLADYLPLENDFPKVYGITEGSLPSKVSDGRKAQSLQLRGYLLFFDHLLSGYLSQLQNLRHLFSFRHSADTDQTYYINKIDNWPGLDKLLRFSLTEDSSSSFGNVHASLVDKQQLDKLTSAGKITDCDFHLDPYSFCSEAERDIAINQLIQDAVDGSLLYDAIPTRNSCWFFYLTASSNLFAFVGPDEYTTREAAIKACEAVIFLAASQGNYRSYITDDKKRFSFHLTSGVAGYWSYLQTLTEPEDTYLQRRKLFLNHLLGRFSESFTDYALLSYSFYQEQRLQQNEIKQTEGFLSQYPELSSSRGRAYDYILNGWNNSNVSGFENRVSAYAGMQNAMQQNLCHFEVNEFDAQSIVNLAWKDLQLFKSEKSFDTRLEAKEALLQLFIALRNDNNYSIDFASLENKHSISVRAGGSTFRSYKRFATFDEADKAKLSFHRFFSNEPLEADMHPSLFSHRISIERLSDKSIWNKQEDLSSTQAELVFQPEMLAEFPDKKTWTTINENSDAKKIDLRSNPDNPAELIDIAAFECAQNKVRAINEVLIFQFTVSDAKTKFLFISEQEFSDPAEAEVALVRFLFLLTNEKNYEKLSGANEERSIKITENGKIVAVDRIQFNDDTERSAALAYILDFVNQQRYNAIIRPTAVRWNYAFLLGLPGTTEFSFGNAGGVSSFKEIKERYSKIYKPRSKLTIVPGEGTLEISDPKRPTEIVASHRLGVDENAADQNGMALDLLSFKRLVDDVTATSTAPEIDQMIIPDGISRLGNFGYRLVQKNTFLARYDAPFDYKTKEEVSAAIKKLFNRFNTGLTFLEIYYGGEIFRELKDPVNGSSRFHFLVRSRAHAYAPGNEIILFESVVDYASVEEAQVAFDTQFTSIMTKASYAENYGTLISFDENLTGSTRRIAVNDPMVFIPADTMKMFGYNQASAVESLTKMAASYPIKVINKADPSFAQNYLCGEVDSTPEDPCGCPKQDKDVYFFKLQLLEDPAAWISQVYFETPREAIRQFYFFLLLLQYKGNFQIGWDQCNCSSRLYIREVLAESSRRFPTAGEAWGAKGVEKFICTVQAQDSIFRYRNNTNCCFTFKVACANVGLIHPCNYDTPEKRDHALGKLLKASGKLSDDITSGAFQKKWENAFAVWRIIKRKKEASVSYCEDVLSEMIEIIRYLWEREDKLLSYLSNETVTEVDPQQLEVLKALAWYFPVKRKQLDIPNVSMYKYFLEINLEDFCKDGEPAENPCGCGTVETGDGCACCCTAWVSECCFDTCEDAIDYLKEVTKCLAIPEHYYPVFDCDCGPYGIRFSCDCNEHDLVKPIGAVNVENNRNRRTIANDCCNEIVAYNPQCYTSSAMVCDAATRAIQLVNAEGLHLVEHILLRPHCKEGDCNCVLPVCVDESSCQFTWMVAADDPCMDGQSFCFLPGADPYSFIATVVLPAWPQRFRTKENRQLIEQILYRETPAHILLRVLWLSPSDLCRFEFLYHNWSRWLAGKPVCDNHNAPCELIDFLFRHTDRDTQRPAPFDCFECAACVPCMASANPVDPCAQLNAVERDPNAYVNAINELFCWPTICPQIIKAENHQRLLIADKAVATPLALPAAPKDTNDEMIAERKMDERLYRYRSAVQSIAEKTNNSNAGMAWQAITQHTFSFEQYQQVVNTLVDNKTLAEGEKKLSIADKKLLIEHLTWHYLDNAIWSDSLEHDKGEVKTFFDKLRKRNLLPDYKNWNGAEIRSMNKPVPLHMIKKFFN